MLLLKRGELHESATAAKQHDVGNILAGPSSRLIERVALEPLPEAVGEVIHDRCRLGGLPTLGAYQALGACSSPCWPSPLARRQAQ